MAESTANVDGQSTVMGISLLILILAAIPTLVSQSFGTATFGLFLAGLVTAVIFGVLNNQGHGWQALGTVQILSLVLFLVAVVSAPALGVIPAATVATVGTLFLVLTFLFVLYAVYGMFMSDHRLPNLAFLFIATMVWAGTTIGIQGMALMTIAALVTIFAWPWVEGKAPARA